MALAETSLYILTFTLRWLIQQCLSAQPFSASSEALLTLLFFSSLDFYSVSFSYFL